MITNKVKVSGINCLEVSVGCNMICMDVKEAKQLKEVLDAFIVANTPKEFLYKTARVKATNDYVALTDYNDIDNTYKVRRIGYYGSKTINASELHNFCL